MDIPIFVEGVELVQVFAKELKVIGLKFVMVPQKLGFNESNCEFEMWFSLILCAFPPLKVFIMVS